MNRQPNEFLSILFIVPTDYGRLVDKGVAPMILERDEGGFWGKVFTVHPYASRTQVLALNETHQLIEFGPDYPFSFLPFRFGLILNYLLKPLIVTIVLIRLIQREHIDVIRATDPFWCGIYAWAAGKMTSIPFCISIHADYDKCYRLDGKKKGIPFSNKILEKFVLPRADLVMPIREYIAQKTLKHGISKDRIRVIPHGLDLNMFLSCKNGETTIRKRYGIDSEVKIISFVGRLVKENYVYDVIEMALHLSKVRDDFVILVVGDGPEHGKMKSLVEKYNLSNIVRLTGFQPRKEAIYVRCCSYLALSLMGGFSLIEACIAGCPVISYDVEWHHELVKNGETGFLIKENDLEALIRAVNYLLDHPSKAEEMGTMARKLAIARHDISTTSEVKINCYRELLTESIEKMK